MAAPKLKACRECSFLDESDVCPRCGGTMSAEWSGFLAVTDFEKSEIAKRMGISANGKYAIKVR